MTITDGIEGLYVETRNYGATAAFWASLGFAKTAGQDGSALWAHPAGRPYVFILEQHDRDLRITPVVRVPDATGFAPSRPPEFLQAFEATHWGTLQAIVADPDGRGVSIEAPAAEGSEVMHDG